MHPAVAAFPRLDDEYARLLLDVKKVGRVLVPLLVNSDNQIIDGRTRCEVAVELKLPTVPVLVDDTVDPFTTAITMGVARRNLTKSAIALMLFELHPEIGEGAAKREQSGREDKGSAKQISARYQVSRNYFTSLVKIKNHYTEQTRDRSWDEVKKRIFNGVDHITRMIHAKTGAVVEEGGHKRVASHQIQLLVRCLGRDTINRFQPWANFSTEQKKQAVDAFCGAFKKFPPAFTREVLKRLPELGKGRK